jgi:tRNA splicing endonuclease
VWLCERARQLRDLFGEAVQELVLLHEQQFLAVVAGDSMATRFDILIHQANERKQNAKYAYMRHLEEHGCSLDDETDTR